MSSNNQPEKSGSDSPQTPVGSSCDSSDTNGCPWCPAAENAPISLHAEWCNKVVTRNLQLKGSRKVKANTVASLEKLLIALQDQIYEYETALRFIAAPERPDGTYNRDRKACELLAAFVLNKHTKTGYVSKSKIKNT